MVRFRESNVARCLVQLTFGESEVKVKLSAVAVWCCIVL